MEIDVTAAFKDIFQALLVYCDRYHLESNHRDPLSLSRSRLTLSFVRPKILRIRRQWGKLPLIAPS